MADNPLAWLRHPRRLGFVIFNLVVIALIIAWGIATSKPAGDGIAGLPTLLIGPAGTVVLIGLLIAGWIAWTLFVIWRRWRKSRHSTSP